MNRRKLQVAVLLAVSVASVGIAAGAGQGHAVTAAPESRTTDAVDARTAFKRLELRMRHEKRASRLRARQGEGEFFFEEVEGRKAGVNSFLVHHAVQQGLPVNLDLTARQSAAKTAWETFRKIKFQGAGKGHPTTWRAIGPETVSGDGVLEPKNSSGRVTDLATGVRCDVDECRLYAGTAGGGLWRSDRALHPQYPRWRLLTNGLDSNNIGSVTVDLNDASGMTLYVGTGESNYSFTSAAGQGLFKSTDGGDSFTRVPTMIVDPAIAPEAIDFTATRGISQVAIKPGSPDTLYVATAIAMMGMTSVRGGQSNITGGLQARVGLYRTTDGGASWSLLFDAPVNTLSSSGTHVGAFQLISGVKDVQLDPQDPDTVYISVADHGLYRSSAANDGNTDFHQVFEVVGSDKSDSYVAFDMTVSGGRSRIYAYNGNGSDQARQALYRLDNADQPHTSLFNGANSAAWVNKSVFVNPEDYADFEICRGQCVYDLVVATPEGRPDTVYIAGVATRSLYDSAIRSTDGGENFSSHAIDMQFIPGRPHVDVRAIVFSPDNPDLAFIGSDGGVVRDTGVFVDGRTRCISILGIPASEPLLFPLCQAALAEVPQEFIFMNRGLQTMQLFNISADPNRPLNRLMAGTQDNSTQWYDGSGSINHWTKVFDVGDGTSANGFHRENPDILFASYQSANFFTHFQGGTGGNENWYFTGGPIQFSSERQYPNSQPGSGRQFITFDSFDADTQYTGYEHIWRTRNNGGSLASLSANACAFTGDYFKAECGDWQPLGPFLTRSNFGGDRAGGVIVAAERSAGDVGTLWAGTSLGRVFVSNNVNASPAAVSFQRVDSAATPPRFVSGIAVDKGNPNRAFVAYSGFSAVTPDAPGHVFEFLYNGATATVTSLDFNLGDIPINHLVLDDQTGDLYAATDFGVLVLPAGASAWTIAGNGLPTVLTPHLEIHPEKRILFAATHGMGAWYIILGKK
jgi:hypothetical protein